MDGDPCRAEVFSDGDHFSQTGALLGSTAQFTDSLTLLCAIAENVAFTMRLAVPLASTGPNNQIERRNFEQLLIKGSPGLTWAAAIVLTLAPCLQTLRIRWAFRRRACRLAALKVQQQQSQHGRG